MKLFLVKYMDDREWRTYFTVGKSKEEVIRNEADALEAECECPVDIVVSEISMVNGYKIKVEE